MDKQRHWPLWASLLIATMAHAEPPPAVGTVAPAFVLPDASGKQRSLAEWQGKWVVLYFYPKDNTPGCTTEALNFRDSLPQFTALNAQIVGISVDSTESHRAFADEKGLPFPLLSDPTGQVAQRYGAYANWGVVKFARRHTFLIDPDGRIAKVYQEVDAKTHAGELMGDLRFFGGR